MCGICGFTRASFDEATARAVLARMTAALRHRGPDEEGEFLDGRVALGVRRLRVIDPHGGRQPMSDERGRLQVVFNGEIYNHVDLRAALESRGHRFRTRCDTEVIAHAYEEFGDDFPTHLTGMFSVAVWDAERGRLVLARDRLGIKPLYYARLPDGGLAFGSELKALLCLPNLPHEIDPAAINEYLTYEYVPAPRTMFRGMSKLPGAHRLVWQQGRVALGRYWRLRFGPGEAPPPTRDEAAERLRELLDRSVTTHLMSDVPLGVLLSGGVDSTTVAYLASRRRGERLRTFTVGFAERSFDESGYAALAARRIHSRHQEMIVSADAVPEALTEIVRLMDEPLGDGSLLPTYLLCRWAREFVTVALSGEGGDELFAGYPTYQAHLAAPIYRLIPGGIRRHLIQRFIRMMPTSMRNLSLDFKIRKFVAGFDPDPARRNVRWLGAFEPEDKPHILVPDLLARIEPESEYRVIEERLADYDGPRDLSLILYLDLVTYLQDDLLVKVDRASMASSLEVRVPLLDHALVEYVAGLPARYKLRAFRGKDILKRAVRPWLPARILLRPKKGFGVPAGAWIRSRLRDLVEDALDPRAVRETGVFQPIAVSRLLRSHLQGLADNRKLLWTILMFQLWHRQYAKGEKQPWIS
jgi:asparagine synthase (glutamine-hydrolysing)